MVGLPACGKTTIYNAVTAAGAPTFDGSEMHNAIVRVPDERLQELATLYNPAKVVTATMKVVDIPGLKIGDRDKPRRVNTLLQHIKEADALLHVVRCFTLNGLSLSDEVIDPVRDVETIDIEMMVADNQTLQNKIERLAKKVRLGDKDAIRQVEDCEMIKKGLEQGIPARRQGLISREIASIRECNLVSLKPVLYIANIGYQEEADNDYINKLQVIAKADDSEVITVYGRDEADISQLNLVDQQEFLAEMGLKESSMTRLLEASYRKLGLVNFFTVGEDEVRAWTCHRGDKAPVAAGKIHTDMEKRFIRMEVMGCDDLIKFGSEMAVIKAGRQRIEGKTYEVQEGDVVVVLFN